MIQDQSGPLGWHRQLLKLNLAQFDADSERADFFKMAPRFITELYPDAVLQNFLPENYGAYMLNKPTGFMNKRRWRRNLHAFAYCSEWITLALPIGLYRTGLTDDAEQRLRAILRATGPTPKLVYHSAARIRINLLTLFDFCEEALENTNRYQENIARSPIPESVTEDGGIYDTWLPFYERVLAGEMITLPRRDLDKLVLRVVELQAQRRVRRP